MILDPKEEESRIKKLGCTLTGESRTYDYKGYLWHKQAQDMEILIEMIKVIKPDFVIECGTGYERGAYYGGSALMMADALKELGNGGIVISLDILDSQGEPQPSQSNLLIIKASSVEPATVALIGEIVKGKRILLNLDSAHTTAHVYKELELYSSLIDIDSYIVVEDSILDAPKNKGGEGRNDGPWHAIQMFLSNHPEWEIDKEWEMKGHSNIDGFLRRKKK